MAYDEALAARIRAALGRKQGIAEKKMFGGLCFLLKGNMLVGVWKESLIARVGEDEAEAALREPHVRPMDITGKPMTGWLLIEAAAVGEVAQVKDWVQRSLKFVGKLPAK